MLRVIILSVVIFVALIFALSMGEDVGRFIYHYLGHIIDALLAAAKVVGGQIQVFFAGLWGFMQGNRIKVLIALLLTVPITYWLLQQQKNTKQNTGPSKRAAIILALLLGWLGAHRFYLNQIGWGIAFLVCCYVFPPLALIVGWVDALRYALMDPIEFSHLYAHQQPAHQQPKTKSGSQNDQGL